MRDYKRHTCTRGIPSIQDPDLELYYIYNDHISIHNNSQRETCHLQRETHHSGPILVPVPTLAVRNPDNPENPTVVQEIDMSGEKFLPGDSRLLRVEIPMMRE
jgi:hypothetical protein